MAVGQRPIPAARPALPAGKVGFYTIYPQLKGYELENGGRALGYWSYWHQGGPLSGPWLPADTVTIAVLNSIGQDAGVAR